MELTRERIRINILVTRLIAGYKFLLYIGGSSRGGGGDSWREAAQWQLKQLEISSEVTESSMQLDISSEVTEGSS